MMSFFSKRKHGGKSNSDSSLYPPPSITTRRANTNGPEALDLATSSASAAAVPPSAPWDGKCQQCRKLMSRCLCHEDTGHKQSSSARANQRGASKTRSPTDDDESANDKRHLLETLSGMHQSRQRSRVPLKMTQDRMRERRVRESQRFSNHAILSASTSSIPVTPSPHGFLPTRSVGPSKSTGHDQDAASPSGRYTRSYPDAKWRSSTAITSTMRLAHDRETAPPRSAAQPKNLLAYDSKKTTNRFNHAASAASPVTMPTAAMMTQPQALKRTESGNLYITKPISRRKPGEPKPDFSRVWEL